MRTFFRYFFSTLLVLSLPVALLLALPKLNGYSAAKLKTGLQQQQTYPQLAQLAQEQVANLTTASGGGTDTISQATAILKQEITPSYVQTKAESLIDQTAAWSTGKSKTVPSVSFNDLKDQLMAKSPVSYQELQDVLAQAKAAEAQAGAQVPQLSSDPQTQAAVQQFLSSSQNLDQAAKGDWTFPLGGALAGVPWAYKMYVVGFWLSLAVAFISFVAVWLLGKTTAGKMKGLGWTLVVAGLWNGLLALAFSWSLGQQWWLRLIPNSGAAGLALQDISKAVTTVLFERYGTIEAGVTIGLIVVGLVLAIVGKMMIKRASAQPAWTVNEATPVSPAPASAPVAPTK